MTCILPLTVAGAGLTLSMANLATGELPDVLAYIREFGSFGALLILLWLFYRERTKLLREVADGLKALAVAFEGNTKASTQAMASLVEEFKESSRETAEQHRALLKVSEAIQFTCERRVCPGTQVNQRPPAGG